jgi:hypothetical protein
VLRFWGYFEEVVDPSIVGSAPLDSAARKVCMLLTHERPQRLIPLVHLQNVRVRECSVLFFLEDGTMQAEEKRQDNSGMMQARPPPIARTRPSQKGRKTAVGLGRRGGVGRVHHAQGGRGARPGSHSEITERLC